MKDQKPISSDAAVKAAKPDYNRDIEIVVTGVEGLRLRIKTSGAKSWTLRYRVKATGERKRYTLGRYLGTKETGLAWARTEAAKVTGQIADGRDPAAEKQADRQALRMVDLLGETDPKDPTKDREAGWYLTEYVKTAGKLVAGKDKNGEQKKGQPKAQKTIATDRSRIAKHLRSRKKFMGKRIDEVTVADLRRIQSGVTPGTWRHLRDILRVVFGHAEEIGVIPKGSNPAKSKAVKASGSKKVDRPLAPEERKRLDEALAWAAMQGSTTKELKKGEVGGLAPHLVRAIKLLVMTGMRRGEVLAMRWEQIDWTRERLRLPTSKTGEKSVPLSPQTMEYLREEYGDIDRVGLVCATPTGKAIDPDGLGRAWRKLREKAKLDGCDGKEPVRLHDLRHSWATDAASVGVPLHVIGAVLGHRSTQTTSRYAHLHDKAIREGLAKAGAAIEAATKGGK